MTETVPLNKLVLSPRNVRKTNGEEDIEGLAESIKAEGLLQNLVVSPAVKKGLFEVDAGGRRLRALTALAKSKHLPRNWPVPVVVIGRENATEASLAENLQKIAMNPADEVEAYAAIVQSYADNDIVDEAERIANCARRFGVTDRHVRQRLALAALAPDILTALRDGDINLGAATAYATHPEHEEQLKVFKAHVRRTGTYGKHDPREIRDALKGRIYAPDHHLVKYIGLDAYREAGGRIEADLFFEEGERDILLDSGLVEKLATEKAELAAQAAAQKAGWLDAQIRAVTAQFYASPKSPKGYRFVWGGNLPKKDRGEAIAYYALTPEGKVEKQSGYFEPEKARDKSGAEARETDEECNARWEAEKRARDLRYRAAKLAAPKVAGTDLEGRAFWPAADSRWIEPITVFEDHVVVTLLVKVPLADVEAQSEEAERRYEFEQQELREEQEAIAAEKAAAEAAGPEDGEDTNVNDEQREVETA